MTPDQVKTLVWGGSGTAVLAGLFWGLLQWLDGWPGPIPDAGERVQLALKLSLGPVTFLITVIMTVSLTRLITGAVDPLKDDPPRWRAVDQRVLANTVEQTLAFLPLFIGTAMVIGPGQSAVLAALAIVFVLARAVFWVGYRRCTICRAPGMAAGFVINIGMLVLIVSRMLG